MNTDLNFKDQIPDCPMRSAKFLREKLEPHGKSAMDKENIADLSDEEVAAILFFSGVGYTIDSQGKVKFNPSGIRRIDGKWRTYESKNQDQ